MSEVKSTGKNKLVIVIAAVVVVLLVVGIFAYTKAAGPAKKYNEAVSLFESGKYEEAIEAFTLMDGYKDSAEMILKCEQGIIENAYNAAMDLMAEGKYEEAIAAFSQLNYSDSAEKIKECEELLVEVKYNEAVSLMSQGNYKDAAALFKTIDYKDSAEKFEECRATAPYDFTEIGDIITFGTYEQDHNEENGRKPLTWRVLDKKDGKLLIITEKVIEKRPFFAIYWKRSALSAFMETSINPGLSSEERNMVVKTLVTADTHPDYPGTDQGSEPEDKFFLLSVDEVEKYFADAEDRICSATELAIHDGLTVDAQGHCSWWLRTACSNWGSGAIIADIDSHGGINASTHNCRLGVRPACWIQLEG